MGGIRIGYVRVSTPEQHPERQIREMTADKFYVDIYTGKTDERPKLKEMMEFIREGDTLVVHSIDRLARNLDDLRKIVLGLLERGITVEFITERLIFDKSPTSMGLLMLSLLGTFAEFERNILAEKRKSGIANARAKGIVCGGRKPKFTNQMMGEIEKMNSLGATKKTMSKYLGVSVASIYNYLKYKGPATRKTQQSAKNNT